MTLQVQLLANPIKRQLLEQAVVHFFESEVAAKHGIEGQLIKTTHANAKKLIPDILSRGVTLALPGLVADFEPEYALARQAKRTFAQHLLRPERRPFLTKAILRAFQRVIAQYPLLVPLFHVIRGRVEHHAGLALPQLAAVLQPFVG
jgi:hypothetical protein